MLCLLSAFVFDGEKKVTKQTVNPTYNILLCSKNLVFLKLNVIYFARVKNSARSI